MRNSSLHQLLEAFACDSALQLSADTAMGHEVPFEIVEERGGRAPLYCYRPLTGAFIRERLGLLSALPSYAPAARALAIAEGVDVYMRERGEPRIPCEPRDLADAALCVFLSTVFAERNEFGFEPERFEAAYEELERSLYEGRCITQVIAPVLGVGLDATTPELALGDGLSLVPGDKLPDAPADAVWADGEQASVLAVLSVPQDRAARPPVSIARVRFKRLLTALRLFERGGYALGPVAFTRTDAGAWRPVPLGGSGRPRFVTLIGATQEDELRAFVNLVSRRAPASGELAWALARFEMGCERLAPFEALTDYLLALRAVLEPEGPQSGRLAGRLAAICADPAGRAAMAERVAHAISLERAVIIGLAPAPDESNGARPFGEAGCRAGRVGSGSNGLVDELGEHLRALLRDVLCGHLDSDLRDVADGLIASAARV